jgi:hypothetical protein
MARRSNRWLTDRRGNMRLLGERVLEGGEGLQSLSIIISRGMRLTDMLRCGNRLAGLDRSGTASVVGLSVPSSLPTDL